MLIPVIYPDGRHDLVKDFLLSILIDEQKIMKFKRSDGWVDISSQQIRGRWKRSSYSGPERRLLDLASDNRRNDRAIQPIM